MLNINIVDYIKFIEKFIYYLIFSVLKEVIIVKFAEKEFDYYWKIIKIPLFVIIGWSVLGFIISLISFQTYQSIFSSISGILLGILVFGFIGWTTIKDHKGEIKHAAWAGALAGIIAGFVGGIIGVIMFYAVPQIASASIQQAVAKGAPHNVAENMIRIGAMIGIIVGPIMNGVIGTIIAAITGLIAKKVKK